ncbi:MAG: sporulation protein YqfD [Clostridium sp.]
MKNRKRFGLDQWKVMTSSENFLWMVKKRQLEVYDITLHQNYICFYASILQRRLIYQSFDPCVKVRTTGILGYILRSIIRPQRVLSIILSVVLWQILSMMIYDIQIQGENSAKKELIQETLKKMNVKPPCKSQDVATLKAELKKRLENDISWLEIEKQGSRYKISYTPKEFASLSELKDTELIAQKDGVIERFDIQHGNKMYKVNEFVHKGDVLVSNSLEDSKGEMQDVFVEGRVFAYVWKDLTLSIPKTKEPAAFQFFELLLEARRSVSMDFHEDDRIYNENILQFHEDMGKIKMVVHYTLIQDITTP